MVFDFTNYTFSFLVSMVAAIFSIGHPIFLGCIQRIDEQYKSTRLSRHFRREAIFRCYNFFLVLAIIISFLAPFLMLLVNNSVFNIAIETVHCLSVLLLAMIMLYMFIVVRRYYDPTDLTEHLGINASPLLGKGGSHPRNTEKLLVILDLMYYASCNNNLDVYQKCRSYILHCVNNEQEGMEYKFYNISEILNKMFRQIADYSTDSKSIYFYNDNIAVEAFYNIFGKFYNGNLNYQVLWYSLFRIMKTCNTEWIRQYWSAATQYYFFVISHTPNEIQKTEEWELNKRQFLEMQWMVGTSMVYNQKYDWLRYILFYTNISPAKYPLVPSTLRDIIDGITKIEQQKFPPWTLTSKYQMDGMFNDVDSDYKIIELAYKYFALLVIRLFSVNDYNITYSDPMQQPEISGSTRDFKKMKQIAEALKNDIGYWYKDNLINELRLPQLPSQIEAEYPLQTYIQSIKEKIDYHEQYPELNKEKMQRLKILLADLDTNNEEDEAFKPTHDQQNMTSSICLISVRNKLETEFISKDGCPDWSNYPEVLYSTLDHKIQEYYNRHFLEFSPIADFRITQRNLFPALDKLSLSEGYTILTMGVNLNLIDTIYNQQESQLTYDKNNDRTFYHENIPVIGRTSGLQSLFIMRSTNIPKIESIEPDNQFLGEDLKLLTGATHYLCTNIDAIIKSGDTQPVIQLAKNIRYYVQEHFSFIRLQVMQNGDDTIDFNRLTPIMNLL